MKFKFFVDSHKGATAFFVLAVMALFNQWENPTAWVYLALHGTYGLLWVLKSRIFPDKRWEEKTSWLFGIFGAWGGLTLYWVAPVLLAWRDVHAPGWVLGLCVTIYAVGVFLHFSADMQKHMWLHLRPGELLTEGLWAKNRNPNYFGELLIYAGFGLLAMHWLPMLILAAWVAFYWWPNMRRKDRSLARYPGFEAYKKRSVLFIPGIW